MEHLYYIEQANKLKSEDDDEIGLVRLAYPSLSQPRLPFTRLTVLLLDCLLSSYGDRTTICWKTPMRRWARKLQESLLSHAPQFAQFC
jgi:hypothetical protein